MKALFLIFLIFKSYSQELSADVENCFYDCRNIFLEMPKEKQRSYLDQLYMAKNKKVLLSLQNLYLTSAIDDSGLEVFNSRLLELESSHNYSIDPYVKKHSQTAQERLDFKSKSYLDKFSVIDKAIREKDEYPHSMSYENIFIDIYLNEISSGGSAFYSQKIIKLISEKSYLIEQILRTLLERGENIAPFFQLLSDTQKNRVLCNHLEEDVISFEEYAFEDCHDYSECVQSIKAQKEGFFSKFSKLGVSTCSGMSLESYLLDFEKRNISYAKDAFEVEDDYTDDYSSDEDCPSFKTVTSDFNIELADNVYKVLLQTKDCSFSDSAERLPEFLKEGVNRGAKALLKEKGTYVSSEGRSRKCNYYFELARKNASKNSKDFQSLEEAYRLLKMVYRGTEP